jgi:F-box protein 21
MMILGDANQASALHRRRQCLPYLAEHFQQHFPEDLGLVQSIIAPMFISEREHTVLMHMITTNRAGDGLRKAPCRRVGLEKKVEFKIGQTFQHKRYGYDGVITGWDARCSAEARWIEQMRVDDLPRGREQPFYNVV